MPLTNETDPLEPAPADETREVPIRREELAVHVNPRSQVAEQFRSLRIP